MKKSILLFLAIVGCNKANTEPAPILYQGKAEQVWLQQVKSGDEAPKVDALQALGHFQDQPAKDALKSSLKDERVSVRYYAAEASWHQERNADGVIPALRSVISDPLGWSERDRMILLFKDMGIAAQPLIPDVKEAISNSPNSRIAKWQDVLNAIQQ